MKTDLFDDAIRRKLEAVNPPFQEKNWTQLQRFMGMHGFPPSLWRSPVQWLQPALTAAALTGIVVTSIWQYQSNKTLTANVDTLTKTVERLERVQIRLQQSVAANPTRIDTVYLTQSDRTGTLPTLGGSMGTSLQARPKPVDNQAFIGEIESVSDRSDAMARSGNTRQYATRTAPAIPVYTPEAAPATRLLQSTSMNNTRPAANQSSANRDVAQRNNRPSEVQDEQKIIDDQPTQSANTVARSVSPGKSANPATPTTDPAFYANPVSNQSPVAATAQPTTIPTASGTLADMTIQPLTPLPLPDQSGALAESWQRHLRRVRYKTPYALVASNATAPAPAKNTTPLSVQWQLGLGGEVGTVQAGLGVFGEVILANHWTVGLGVSQTTWTGDAFQTEQQFLARTKRDFRRDYPIDNQPPPSGPDRPRNLVDISRSGQSLIIPVQVGYRVSAGKLLTLTPFVGFNLSIAPKETISFIQERPLLRDQDVYSLLVDRPALRYSSWAVGFGIGRQFGRFAGQISPVAMVPLTGGGGLNQASVGLRGCLFYRF